MKIPPMEEHHVSNEDIERPRMSFENFQQNKALQQIQKQRAEQKEQNKGQMAVHWDSPMVHDPNEERTTFKPRTKFVWENAMPVPGKNAPRQNSVGGLFLFFFLNIFGFSFKIGFIVFYRCRSFVFGCGCHIFRLHFILFLSTFYKA